MHLVCQHCHRSNPADVKFCGECGFGLRRKDCPSCQAVNDPEAHFCQACGTLLSPMAAYPTPAFPPLPFGPGPGTGGAARSALPAEILPGIKALTPVTPITATTTITQVEHSHSRWPDSQPSIGPHSVPPDVAATHGALAWSPPVGAAAMAGGSRGPSYVLPFVIGLAVVGAISLAAFLWSESSSPPTAALKQQARAGGVPSMSAPAPRASGADAAADAAAEAAAKLLATYPERSAGKAAPAVATGPANTTATASVPEDRRPPERARPAAPPPRAEPPPLPTAATTTAPATLRTNIPVARNAEPAAATFEPPRPPRTVRTPSSPPPALPRECTPAMDAMALCAPGSKPSGS